MAYTESYFNSKAIDIDSNGTGFAWYPKNDVGGGEGRIALCILILRGEKRIILKDDTDKEINLGVLFEHLNNSFINYDNGSPRLVLNRKGGTLISLDGKVIREWQWQKHGVEVPFEPLELSVGTSFVLKIRSRKDISLSFRSFPRPFSIFQSRPTSFPSDDGSTSTMKKQLKKDPLELVHRMNWTLPRVNGRESVACSLPHSLQLVQTNCDAIKNAIDNGSFDTSIGTAVDTFLHSVKSKAIEPRDFSSSGTISVTSHTVHQKKEKVAVVDYITDRGYQHYITKRVPADKLLVACCSNKVSKACSRAEDLLYQAALKWGDLATRTDFPYQLVVVDVSASQSLLKRYNLSITPVFIFLYGGKLLYIGQDFDRCCQDLDSFLVMLNKCKQNAVEGKFLPTNYKLVDLHSLESANEVTLKSLST